MRPLGRPGAPLGPRFKSARQDPPRVGRLLYGLLLSITVAAFAIVAVAWIALAPQQTFLGFLSGSSTLAPLTAWLSVAAAAWFAAYKRATAVAAGGWLERVLHWLVERPGLHRAGVGLCAVVIGCAAAAAAWLLRDPPLEHERVFEGRHQEVAALAECSSPMERKPLHCLAAAARIEWLRRASQAEDMDCLSLLPELSSRRAWGVPVAQRYLGHFTAAWCFAALESPRQARDQLREAAAMARLMAPRDVIRAQIAEAGVVLATTSPARLALRSKDDLALETLAILERVQLTRQESDDMHIWRARRLISEGSAHHQLQDYSAALARWRLALSALEPVPQSADGELARRARTERVRATNNQMLALMASGNKSGGQRMMGRAASLADQLSEQVEGERTEKIRLLANGALFGLYVDDCPGALALWARREAIKQQEPSACSRLLEAQVLSCDTTGRERVLQALLRGVNGEAAVHDTAGADQGRLLPAAEKTFSRCYGASLAFQNERVRAALAAGR